MLTWHKLQPLQVIAYRFYNFHSYCCTTISVTIAVAAATDFSSSTDTAVTSVGGVSVYYVRVCGYWVRGVDGGGDECDCGGCDSGAGGATGG